MIISILFDVELSGTRWKGGQRNIVKSKMGYKRYLADLDVQENDRDEPGQKRLKATVKDCPKCGESVSLNQYSINRKTLDGLNIYC